VLKRKDDEILGNIGSGRGGERLLTASSEGEEIMRF
jgi:hypothetical protein